MQLQDLLDMQKGLDKKFSNGLQIRTTDKLTSLTLALMVEAAEFANEMQTFKFWKHHIDLDMDKAGEEFIDILFFWLDIANEMGFCGNKLEELYIQKFAKNIDRIETGY